MREYMREDMREYMRNYRQKQKETKQVINLLLNSLQRIVEVINNYSQLLSSDRIQRINERTNDIIAYGNLLIQTFDEIKDSGN